MGDTLKTQNFQYLSTSFKKMQSDLFYGEICLAKMTKIVILPYFTQKTMSLILRQPKHTPHAQKTMSLILRQPKHNGPHVFRNRSNP
jgi:hypothetical protein